MGGGSMKMQIKYYYSEQLDENIIYNTAEAVQLKIKKRCRFFPNIQRK